MVQSGMTPSQRENAVPLMLEQTAAPVGALKKNVLEASFLCLMLDTFFMSHRDRIVRGMLAVLATGSMISTDVLLKGMP